MEEPEIKALFALLGVIGGALITALASAYAARQKIREINLNYALKLEEGYLEKARQYTNAIYVPLNIELEKLRIAYEELRIYRETKTMVNWKKETFLVHIQKYLQEYEKMMMRGADSFMTSTLDEKIRAFNSFLKYSASVQEEIRRIIFELATALPFSQIEIRKAISVRGKKPMTYLDSLGYGIKWFGFFSANQRTELLAAPVESKSFEQKFILSIFSLKHLIKEVTLGIQKP